jgi:hypothetical protein
VHIEHREGIGQAVFRILRQPVAMRRHQGKDAKDTLRAGQQRRVGDIDPAVLHHEVRAGNGSALAPLRSIERLPRRRQGFHGQNRAAIDRACMPVIGPHPVGGVGSSLGFQTDTLRRGFILGMPVQAVVVAAAAEVQKAARRAEKFERRGCVVVRRVKRVAKARRPLLLFPEMVQQV